LLAIEKGSIREAYEKLESIPSGHKDFSDALVELQKIHYRRQDWGKFFAYAQFYRVKTAMTDSTAPLKARMISLEAMALAKHCLWEKADEILNWGIAQKDRLDDANSKELLAAREYLRLHNQFPKSALAREDTRKLPSVFSTEQAWTLQAKALRTFSHPKALTVRLKSECVE
jgi:hypothetical protein